MSKDPVRVAVTGGAGQIGYSILFRIASGQLLGPDQPVVLHLLEITPALDGLRGVAMELEDCALPLLAGVVQTDDANVAFEGVNYALLVGSRPRTKGMERGELLAANGAIFTAQGKALSDNAADDVRILVVGNPANTNCLIAMNNAPNIPDERFTAMTRLDHNRAKAQVALKAGVPVSDVTNMTIWGNHSATQYPDLFRAKIAGRNAAEAIDDQAWLEDDFIPTVQKRGAAIIEARGLGRQRRHRPRPHLGRRHLRGRLGQHGHPLRRLLRRARRPHLVLPRHHQRRPVRDRAGPRARRLQPRAHRRLRRRARRGARRGHPARPDLSAASSVLGPAHVGRADAFLPGSPILDAMTLVLGELLRRVVVVGRRAPPSGVT